MVGTDPVLVLQELTKRREALISKRARLEERLSRIRSEQQEMLKKLQDKGLNVDALEEAIETMEKSLLEDLRQFDEALKVHEDKVRIMESKLGDI
jgi:DNA helicase IV